MAMIGKLMHNTTFRRPAAARPRGPSCLLFTAAVGLAAMVMAPALGPAALAQAPVAEPAKPADPPKTGDTPAPTASQPPPESSPEGPVAGPAEPEEDVPTMVSKAIAKIDQADDITDNEKLGAVLEEVRVLLDKIVAKERLNEEAMYIRGCLLAYARRTGDALDELEKYLKTRTGRNDWRGFRQLGDVYLKTNYPTQAQARYEAADRLKPGDPRVLLGLSKTASLLGKKDKSVEYAAKAVDAAPPDKKAPYLEFAARTMIAQKQWDEADKFAREAITRLRLDLKSDPGRMMTLQSIENLLQVRAEVSRARITAKPDTFQAYLDFADVVVELGDVREQIAHAEVINLVDLGLAAMPANPPMELLERKAHLLEAMGRSDEAKAVYEQIIAKDPNHAAAKEFLGPREPAAHDNDSPGTKVGAAQ